MLRVYTRTQPLLLFMDTKMLSYTPKYYTIEYEHKNRMFKVTLDKVASAGIPKDATIVDIDYTLADTPPPVVNERIWWSNNQKEGTNPMYDECTPRALLPANMPQTKTGFKAKAVMANAQIINAAPVEASQRDYAIELIKKIGEDHAQALRVQFHMDGDRPKTAVELIAAIKDGNYTLDQVRLADFAGSIEAGFYNNEFGIRWGKPADAEGYKAAKEVLKAAAQKALTAVTLKPIDQLEAVIDDFEAWTLPNA